MASILVCSTCEWDNTPDGGRVFATVEGAAYHAARCAEYRAEHGIPDDAPGVIRKNDKPDATLDNVLDILANGRKPAQSAPVTATAAETIEVNGRTYRPA